MAKKKDENADIEDVRDDVTEKPAKKADDSHLVTVHKNGVDLRVHPSCVAAHEGAGWKRKG